MTAVQNPSATAAAEPTLKTHLSLNVKDVEKSTAFYEAFFGVPAHKRRTCYANFDLDRPALKLALQQNPPCCGGTLNHLGIQVSTLEEVEAARDRLKAAGLASFDEGDTTCCYARQNKVWATDPDGNKWEVYVLLDDLLDEEDDHEEEHAEAAVAPVAEKCCA